MSGAGGNVGAAGVACGHDAPAGVACGHHAPAGVACGHHAPAGDTLGVFLAAAPRPQRAAMAVLLALARRPRGAALLASAAPLLDQLARTTLALGRYDEPAAAAALGYDAAAVVARGRALRRAEGRP